MAIHKIGKIQFFNGKVKSSYNSPIDALQAHIQYIGRYGWNNFTAEKLNNLFMYADERLRKRKDARFALKTFFCLPNKYYHADEKMKKILEDRMLNFISENFKVRKEDILLSFHPEKDNFHVHVVMPSRSKDGKPLEFKPSEIQEIHINWDKLLAEAMIEEVVSIRAMSKLVDETINLNLPNSIYKQKKDEVKSLNKKLKKEVVMTIKELQEKQVKKMVDFLFTKEDSVFIVAINPKNKKVRQEKKFAISLKGSLLSYLRSLNAKNYNIYFSLNTFKRGAVDRTVESVEDMQDKIYFDVDGDKLGVDGWKFWQEVMKNYQFPKPSIVIRTSEKNIQVIYKLESKVEKEKLTDMMKIMNEKMHLDKVQDPARVFRLPGFKDWKRGKSFVKLEEEISSFQTVSLDSFMAMVEGRKIEKLENQNQKVKPIEEKKQEAKSERVEVKKVEKQEIKPMEEKKQEVKSEKLEVKEVENQKVKPIEEKKQEAKEERAEVKEVENQKVKPIEEKKQEAKEERAEVKEVKKQEIKPVEEKKVEKEEVKPIEEKKQEAKDEELEDEEIETEIDQKMLFDNYIDIANEMLLKLGIPASLENIKDWKQENESIVDWAFCREVLRHKITRKNTDIKEAIEITKFHLQVLMLYRYEPKKSKNYVDLTVEKALESLHDEIESLQEEEEKQENIKFKNNENNDFDNFGFNL